jgi:hypothetical protein
MKDDLEGYIRAHRRALDDQNPPEKIWGLIEGQLTPQTKKTSFHVNMSLRIFRFSVAASVLVIFIAGWLLIGRRGNDQSHPLVSGSNRIIEEIDPGYAKQVSQFTSMIEKKQSEIKQIQGEEPVLYQEFAKDIERLDSSYNTLKFQLPENPNREQLLQAMISNLQLQTELLNQQLEIIQKIKNVKTTKNENSFKTM